MKGHTLRQLTVAEDVGNDQQMNDRRSPSRNCPNCGAEGDKTHGKDTCPAGNKDCFSFGTRGHYGRVCGKEKEKETPMEGLDTGGTQPRNGEDQSKAPGAGVAKSQDMSTGRQSGEKMQGFFSANDWRPLESRVWRPGMASAHDYLKLRRGPTWTELAGKWDMDLSG
jgi:hypothetical protein